MYEMHRAEKIVSIQSRGLTSSTLILLYAVLFEHLQKLAAAAFNEGELAVLRPGLGWVTQ